MKFEKLAVINCIATTPFSQIYVGTSHGDVIGLTSHEKFFSNETSILSEQHEINCMQFVNGRLYFGDEAGRVMHFNPTSRHYATVLEASKLFVLFFLVPIHAYCIEIKLFFLKRLLHMYGILSKLCDIWICFRMCSLN